jgi:hypothetical protein
MIFVEIWMTIVLHIPATNEIEVCGNEFFKAQETENYTKKSKPLPKM